MQLQTLVKHKGTGRLGVVTQDCMSCCDEGEVPVVFEGTTFFEGTPEGDLEVIGPENAVADMDKCGAGQGEKCCMFLVVDANGPSCQRFGRMRNDLTFRTMTAKRNPNLLFPNCRL